MRGMVKKLIGVFNAVMAFLLLGLGQYAGEAKWAFSILGCIAVASAWAILSNKEVKS